MLNTIKADQTNLKFRYIDAGKHHRWVEGEKLVEQTRDENTGFPLWQIDVTAIDTQNREGGNIRVTIPLADEPDIDVDTEIVFDNLVVSFWEMNGNRGHRYKADNINPAKTTSTRKPSTPPTSS